MFSGLVNVVLNKLAIIILRKETGLLIDCVLVVRLQHY